MAEFTDPPPKKKKTLAFLRSAPRSAPTYDEDFDSNDEQGRKSSKEDDDDDDDGLDMFRRSKDFFPMVIKKQDPNARKATPESKIGARKHTAEDSDEEPVASSSRSSKRRKTSSPVLEDAHPWRVESFDELYGPATPPRRATKSPTPASRKSNRKQSTPASAMHIKHASSPSSGKSNDRDKEMVGLVQSDLLPTPTSRSNSHQLPADVAAFVDDDDDAAGTGGWRDHSPSPRKESEEQAPSNAILIDDSDDDDLFATASEPKEDEFASFIAAARKKREDAKAAAAALAPSHSSSDNEQDPLTPNATRARRKKSAPFIPVKIFVHSRIAAYADYDVRGFGCHRRIEQDVGPVRRAYTQWLRQKGVPVSDEMAEAIFLTWKGRRIYDSVSGLGLDWQPQGNSKARTAERGPGFTKDGVLLEAWTEEDFERHAADEDRQRSINRGEVVEDGPEVEDDDDAEEADVVKIKILLKEKGRAPLGLSATMDTQVRVLIGAYRKQLKIAADREIKLLYEGDWLRPEMTVEEADIDNLCIIEVYLGPKKK